MSGEPCFVERHFKAFIEIAIAPFSRHASRTRRDGTHDVVVDMLGGIACLPHESLYAIFHQEHVQAALGIQLCEEIGCLALHAEAKRATFQVNCGMQGCKGRTRGGGIKQGAHLCLRQSVRGNGY